MDASGSHQWEPSAGLPNPLRDATLGTGWLRRGWASGRGTVLAVRTRPGTVEWLPRVWLLLGGWVWCVVVL